MSISSMRSLAGDLVDFVWVGQWLHHLMDANKLGTMREIRDVLPGRVTLLI